MHIMVARSGKFLSKPANRRLLLTLVLPLLLLAICFSRWSHTSVSFYSLRNVLTLPRKQRRPNSFSKATKQTRIHSRKPSTPTIPPLQPLNFGCMSPIDDRTRLKSNCAMVPSSGKFDQLTPGARLPGGHSQSHEDREVIERYFFGQEGCTFLEMGGLDGITYSNSYYWEKYMSWTGLLIEGSPLLYERLSLNRPHAVTVNAMVCAETRKLHWIDSKNAVGGFYELMPKSFVAQHHKNRFNKRSLESFPIVPCLRLDAILRKHGIVHVDVWTLDVEGAELSVLKTVDFSRFSASVIVVEHRKDSPGVAEFLMKKKYVQVERIGNNFVFLHPMFQTALEESMQKDTR